MLSQSRSRARGICPSDGVPGISDFANLDVRGPGRRPPSNLSETWGGHVGEGGSGHASHANSQALLHGREQQQVQKVRLELFALGMFCFRSGGAGRGGPEQGHGHGGNQSLPGRSYL